jgi:hypothetical protein
VTVAPVLAADLYVNNTNGSDSLNGRVPYHIGGRIGPLQTMREALRRVVPGQRIVMVPTPRPYTEDVVVSGSRVRGMRRYPIVIEGNGVEWIGTKPLDVGEFRYLGENLYESGGPTRTGALVRIGDRPAARSAGDRWGVRPELAPNQYALWRGNILFRVEPGKKIEDYSLAETKTGCGMLIHRASHVVVRNVRFRGFRHDAVQVRGPVEGVRFENCRLAECGRAGVASYTNARVELTGCFLEDNLSAGAIGNNYSNVRLVSCKVSGTKTPLLPDSTSVVEATGSEPAPLAPGPFVPLDGFREPQRAKAEEPTGPTKPPAPTGERKKFFDE